MWTAPQPGAALPKPELYSALDAQLRALIGDETDAVANMSNCAALLYHSLEDVNWVGFYLLKAGELVLGPFQGRPACIRIAMGRGVCGTAAARRETMRIANVNDFPGHIACDGASKSELVLPLIVNDGPLIGVLDLDSPSPDRFDAQDETGLATLAQFVARKISLGSAGCQPASPKAQRAQIGAGFIKTAASQRSD